jgi:hypothetical protein
MDQGTDGLAASWWMHASAINSTIWCDWSHGAWNDCKGALKDNQLMGFWMLILIMMNLPHGPYNDDVRHAQVTAAWAECKQNFKHYNCPLFTEYASAMLDDIGGPSALNIDPGADPGEALWASLMEEDPLAKKGYKCNLNRFFGGTRLAREDCKKWHQRLFQYEYTALECGMLNTARVQKVMVKDSDMDAQEAVRTTDSSRVCVSEKALRSCCQNSMVISVAMLRDPNNLLLLKIICTCTQPLEDWHGHQNRALRDASSSGSWLVDQLDGDFMKHVLKTLGLLSNQDALETCGFELPRACSKGSKSPSPPSTDNSPFLRDDHLADLMGDFTLSLAAHRVARCLHLLRGWPFRMAGLLGTEALATATVSDFQADLQAFEKLKKQPQVLHIKNFIARSVFNQVSVQQYVEAAAQRQHL